MEVISESKNEHYLNNLIQCETFLQVNDLKITTTFQREKYKYERVIILIFSISRGIKSGFDSNENEIFLNKDWC